MTITLPQTLPTGVESLIVSQSVDGVEWELVEGNQIVKDNQYVVVATATEGYTIQNPIKSGAADANIEVTSTDFEGKITPPAPAAVAQIGSTTYPSLGEAIAALTGGETIKLLANYTATAAEANNLTFNANATLDLNEKTLTVPGAVMTTQKFATAAGTEVTFTNGVINMPEEGGNRGITINGTLNLACTVARSGGNAVPAFDVMDGAIVNAGDAADVTSDAIIFWVKKAGNRTFNITGGKYKATQNTTGTDYDVFYVNYEAGYATLNITGGEFTGKNGIIANCKADGLVTCSLDDTCKAKFSNVGAKTSYHDVAYYIADGYEAVQGVDDYYTIQAIPTYTVAGITVANASVVATNKTAGGATFALPADLLRDTQIAVTVTPDTDYEYATTPAGWTKNENDGSITTNATVTADLAITVEAPTAAAAPWPDDPSFPSDADDEVKGKYADWAKTYGVTTPAGKSDAFLMNVDPTGTVPELEIQEISVEGTTATITVGTDATEFDLSKINGVLYVESTDELAGEWTIEQYDLPTGEVGQTATFTVTAGKFMRAKVGFKAPPQEPVTEP